MPVNFRCRSNSNREDRPPRVIGIAVMLLPAALLAAACTSARPDPAPDDSADAGVTREISSSSVPQSLDFGSCQGCGTPLADQIFTVHRSS